MFDLTFLRFLLGFLVILSVSFAVLFFVGKHVEAEKNLAETQKNGVTQIK